MSQFECSFDELIGEAPAVTISGMTLDSRQVNPGDLFVALAGASSHGLEYVSQAIERGCAAVLWERADELANPILEVPALGMERLSEKVSALADQFYARPSAALTVIGVTGTNGKSSCVEFIAQGLCDSGFTAGTIGTLGSGVLGQPGRALSLTTPDAITVQRELASLKAAGCTHVAMEVSSHALVQGRVAGVRFAVALVTNTSRDHLDYHGSMARYISAKARLLSDFCPKVAILNADDGAFAVMREALCDDTRLICFGMGRGDLQASQMVFEAGGCQFLLQMGTTSATVSTALIGSFNVANLMAVASVMVALQCTSDATAAAQLLARLRPPVGRMQQVSKPGWPLIVVDYAHTPDALKKALAAIRAHCNGDLYCVFGCGGDRDRGKRKVMGAVAVAGADQVVITSDNPRSEAPDQIISDILAGARPAQNVIAIADRRAAITHAVERAGKTDAVLVAGKGHEKWQEIDGEKIPFDDLKVVSELLEACA